MAKFFVREAFEIPDRRIFVLAGEIVEGEVHPGMFVRIPWNSEIGMRLLIDSIEFVRRQNGEDVCLCIRSGPSFVNVLDGLNFADETFEVSTEGI